MGHAIPEDVPQIEVENSEVKRVEGREGSNEDGLPEASSNGLGSDVAPPPTNRPIRSIQFADESPGSRSPQPRSPRSTSMDVNRDVSKS